jgi:hypothetical protein
LEFSPADMANWWWNFLTFFSVFSTLFPQWKNQDQIHTSERFKTLRRVTLNTKNSLPIFGKVELLVVGSSRCFEETPDRFKFGKLQSIQTDSNTTAVPLVKKEPLTSMCISTTLGRMVFEQDQVLRLQFKANTWQIHWDM